MDINDKDKNVLILKVETCSKIIRDLALQSKYKNANITKMVFWVITNPFDLAQPILSHRHLFPFFKILKPKKI